MANPAKRLPENTPGDFFVDDTCIDCDACRQIAPETFRDHGGQSSVYSQPAGEAQARRALMALVACPTGSIGAGGAHDPRVGIEAFPEPLDANLYFCGFTAESSFGAWSYLLIRPDAEGGNILVDSPRFNRRLVRRIRELGGLGTIFLTHRDDVADHERYAREFGARRVMHAADGAARLGVEHVLGGEEPARLDADLVAIPTPGHTRGHCVLLYRDKYLFTGDHLAWSPSRQTLTAFRDACWYSWERQTRSMERLLDYSFEWVLPGHGRLRRDSAEAMRRNLARCLEWMRSVG
ncbi:MAG TPA: MBL fold metallo-hydrolase [Pyrinomonadaceae bacterium]|nr:MBL fold metallo-hydrolase [Pyrinomonadaceae bacterium]